MSKSIVAIALAVLPLGCEAQSDPVAGLLILGAMTLWAITWSIDRAGHRIAQAIRDAADGTVTGSVRLSGPVRVTVDPEEVTASMQARLREAMLGPIDAAAQARKPADG